MTLAPYQQELITRGRDYGMLLLLWRRQGRKTTTFAWQALRWMLEHKGCLVTFATCSLGIGSEMSEREVSMLLAIVDAIRTEAAGPVESTADQLPWYDVAEMYTKNRLEVRLHHDRTTASRTKIIASSYDTARGLSGYVMLDEIGFIRDFKLFFEAVEPIFSSNPAYRLWMATTPPEDDSHFSYELAAYPPGMEFQTNPRGNWFENESGLPVHRVSAQDADAAGVPLYDSKTRRVVTPEEHRAKALDKSAWDRNYGLVFQNQGVSAVGLVALIAAQSRGTEHRCVWAEDELPPDWAASLVAGADTGIGADPATTEREKSNPFGVAVVQLVDGVYAGKLLFRFRSADPVKCRAILREVASVARPRCLCIDATSERFWAAETKDALADICEVKLVVNSERTEYHDESMTFKTYLGNLAVGAIEDRQAALPSAKACRDDFRLVRRFRGGFDNQLDAAGNHADTFDAYKLAIHALTCDAGKVEASGCRVGFGAAEPDNNSSSRRMHMRPDHGGDSRPSGAERLLS